MATIKSHTSLEQSKVLAEFLSPESADMWYINGDPDKISVGKWNDNEHDEDDVPCWSLAALLQILPIEAHIEIDNICCTLDINRDTLGKWFVSYNNRSYGSSLVTCASKELLDACYKMIMTLKRGLVMKSYTDIEQSKKLTEIQPI